MVCMTLDCVGITQTSVVRIILCSVGLKRFYARKQNASRVFVIVWASVRLSVCHTRDLYQNGAS